MAWPTYINCQRLGRHSVQDTHTEELEIVKFLFHSRLNRRPVNIGAIEKSVSAMGHIVRIDTFSRTLSVAEARCSVDSILPPNLLSGRA